MPMFVRLVNMDAKPFDFHHANVKRIVPPGGDTIVPWELAITLFGDPTVVDTPRAKDRQRSIQQCRSNFGYMDGGETAEAFDERRPHIEVWDIETSPPERLHMLIEDPEGLLGNPEALLGGGQGDVMEQMSRQIAALTRMVEQMAGANLAAQIVNRPDGQTVIPSTDAPGPLDPNAPVPLDDPFNTALVNAGVNPGFGFAVNPNATMTSPDLAVQQVALTPEQVAQLQAWQAMQDGLQVQQIGTGDGLMGQFGSTMAGMSMPDDTDTSMAAAPPVIPVLTPDAPAPGEPAPAAQATVDTPPTTPQTSLPPRLGSKS